MKINDFKFHRKLQHSLISNEKNIVDSFISDTGFLKIGGFKYSYAPAEDYYFITPQPKLKSLDDYYNRHGKPLTQKALDNSLRDYNKKGHSFQTADYYSKQIQQLKKQGNFLDFGCGNGLLLYHNKNKYKVYGVEISWLARKHCRKLGIKINQHLWFKNTKFDIITAIDVIEHIPDPKKLLLDFKKILKSDGIIFLRLPVINGIAFDRQNPHKWKWVYAPYHLSMFSIKAIKRLSEACDLDCEILYDETMLVKWDLFWFRWRDNFIMKNAGTRKICHLLFPIIRKFIIKRYSSDTIFAVLKQPQPPKI